MCGVKSKKDLASSCARSHTQIEEFYKLNKKILNELKIYIAYYKLHTLNCKVIKSVHKFCLVPLPVNFFLHDFLEGNEEKFFAHAKKTVCTHIYTYN